MDHDTPNALAGLMAGGFVMTILLVTLAFSVFFVWLFWRVFTKAGYNGALGLLCLVPSIGVFVCMLILAFGTWPIEERRGVVGPVITPAVQ